MGRLVLLILLFAAVAPNAPSARGQLATATVLVGELDRPSAIAVRPGNASSAPEIYFADFDEHDVRRFRTDTPNETTAAITSLPAGEKKLFFLDRNRLVVSVEAAADSPSLLLFELKDNSTEPADQAAQKLVLREGENSPTVQPKSVLSFTRTLANDRIPDLLIVAIQDADRPAEFWKLPIRAGTLDKPAKFMSEFSNFAAVRLATSNQGYVVVSSSADGVNGGNQRLTFFSPSDGKQVMSLSLDLNDIRALAYSPRSRNLYVANHGGQPADFNREKSGIFRIEDTGQPGAPSARAVRIADVGRPVAMAFAADGSLYIATEAEKESSANKDGAILKLVGEL